MRKLSKDDREIRRSRGIPIWRFWPFATLIVTDCVVGWNNQLFQRCIWNSLDTSGFGYRGARVVAALRLLFAIPCSIYRPGGNVVYWTSLAIFVIAIPFAVLQFRWLKRNGAYWNEVRKQEKLKRAERRLKKAAAVE